MGKYRIIIEGHGLHHNQPPRSEDADKIANDTAATLAALGHEVTTARIDLLDPSSSETVSVVQDVAKSQDLLTGAWFGPAVPDDEPVPEAASGTHDDGVGLGTPEE